MLLVLAPVIASAFVFHSILGNYFFADDFAEFYRIANFGASEAILAPSTGHLLILRNAVTAVLYSLFRMNAAPYFLLVLLTHLANVALLFVLVRRTTRSDRLAYLGALLFGIVPTHVGTLEWYAVYGQVLACSLVLLAFLVLVPGSKPPSPLSSRAALLYAALMIAASQSFGTGTAAALASPLVAELIRPGSLRNPRSGVLLVAIPVVVAGLGAFVHLRASRIGQGMDVRVTLSFARHHLVLPMLGHLLALGTTTLLLGAAYPLGRYPDALAVAVPAFFALALLATAFRGDAPTRRMIIASLGVVVCVYGVIAAGRAGVLTYFRSNDWLAAVVGLGRYHYLAHAFLAMLLCLALAQAAAVLHPRRPVTALLLAAWTVLAVGAELRWPPGINHWDDDRQIVANMDAAIREEVQRSPAGATACIEDRGPLNRLGWKAVPGWAGVYLMLHGDGPLDGRRVLFVTSDTSLLALRPEHDAVAALLRAPHECPAPREDVPREG
jgi:hypothetical protein